MVKSPIEHKEPNMGSLDRPYRETGTSGFGHYPCWAFCVPTHLSPIKNFMENKILEEILNKQKEILARIDPESISVYLFLKKEYKKGNIISNHLFQFVFRSYYRLDNAGLGDKIKNEYFKLLAEKESSLEKILLRLYKIKNERGLNTVQFSFATKLLHTLDNSLPIYDTEVFRVIHKKPTGEKIQKIKSCLDIYESLKEEYSGLLLDPRTEGLLLSFRKKFNVSETQISNVKTLDFIIWSLGKIKKKKKHRSGDE
jgi:hypothetical protein